MARLYVLLSASESPMSSVPAPSQSDLVIDIDQLVKTYREGFLGRSRVPALRGVTIGVRRGEVFGLLGPNGAGKTTLIKILLGIARRDSGRASILGTAVGSYRGRQRVGYLPENLRIDRHHTARSALWLYGSLSRMTRRQMRGRADELLELVGLSGRDREPVRRFSKGMYQRLGLAQALMHDPDLLILDEPTDGLDPVGRSEVRQLLKRLREAGKTIFLNSHILQEVELICDRVAVLAQGTVRGIGPVSELTAASGQLRLEMDVAADVAAVLTALPLALRQQAAAVERPLAIGGGPLDGCHLSLPLHAQPEIDACVDALRGAGLSIRRMQVVRPSLEDAFLGMIGTDPSAKAH